MSNKSNIDSEQSTSSSPTA
ncbi:unnamed protein product, partial [Rotaria magnacalcarata]